MGGGGGGGGQGAGRGRGAKAMCYMNFCNFFHLISFTISNNA